MNVTRAGALPMRVIEALDVAEAREGTRAKATTGAYPPPAGATVESA